MNYVDVIYIDPAVSSKEPTDIFFDGDSAIPVWADSWKELIEVLVHTIMCNKPRLIIVDATGAGGHICDELCYRFKNVLADNGSYHRHKREYGITG